MLLKFTKAFRKGHVWIEPAHIIAAVQYEKGEEEEDDKTSKEVKDPKPAVPAKKEYYTLVHTQGKIAKYHIKESPEQINDIVRKYNKKEIKIEM